MKQGHKNRYFLIVKGALFVLGVILFYFVGAYGIASADDTLTIKIGLYENNPKIFTDDAGNAAGLWPDIIQYIALKERWKIEYVHGTWAECLDKLEKNEIDVMPDVAYTEDRDKIFDFSQETVYVSWSRVYARTGANIQSVLDLEGKSVAVLEGSVNVEGPDGIKALAKAFNINCIFIPVDSYIKVFDWWTKKKSMQGWLARTSHIVT